MMMRRRGPGLVRVAATTAVVAGTAGAVRHHQDQKYSNQQAQQQAQQQEIYNEGVAAGQAAAPVAAAPVAAAQQDPTTAQLEIPVTIEIEPQRIIPGAADALVEGERHRAMANLVARGLRAQLQTGNLLTGELFVDLVFAPDAPAAELDLSGPVPVLPSVPATLEALQASATGILNKIAALPIEQLVQSLNQTAAGLEKIVNAPELQTAAASFGPAINDVRQIIAKLDEQTGPFLTNVTTATATLNTTLKDAQTAIASIQRTLGSGSALTNNAENLMQELTRAARSIRVFADYLERNPQALLRGKSGGGGQ